MERHSVEIERIMKDQIGIFEQIYSLEERKTNAIIEHDGARLEKISNDQENLLARLQAIESDRLKQIADYNRLKHDKKISSLKDFAESIGGTKGSQLKTIGRILLDVMSKLSNLQATNKMLINDNMEYYNILLTGLRGNKSLDAGYSPEGKETETVKGPILFNQTA